MVAVCVIDCVPDEDGDAPTDKEGVAVLDALGVMVFVVVELPVCVPVVLMDSLFVAETVAVTDFVCELEGVCVWELETVDVIVVEIV